VVTALEVAGVEAFVQVWPGLPGRPPYDRAALARAFLAKAGLQVRHIDLRENIREWCGLGMECLNGSSPDSSTCQDG
jgi:hypothetical protein